MEIDINTVVECEDSCCGTVTNIIINPVSQTIAYLAIKEKTASGDEVLVPINMIGPIIPEHIHLNCKADELKRFPRFIEQNFIKMDVPDRRMTGYLMLPYVLPKNLMIPIGHKRIPEGALAVRRGACVQATDGEAGRVDEFLVDPANGQITHLVMRQGHVIGKKEVSIPLNAIERMDEQNIYLSLDKTGLKSLPYIPIWRSFMPEWYWAASELIKISVTSSAKQIDDIAKLIAGLACSSSQKRRLARQDIVAIGKPAIPSLNGLLDKTSHRLRWEAAKALAQIQDPACAHGLLTAMEDERFEIRWIAAEGMAALGMPAVKLLLNILQKTPDSSLLRESAHHVIRAAIKDTRWHEMEAVLLELEKFGTAAASLPRAAKLALESLRTYAGRSKKLLSLSRDTLNKTFLYAS